MQEESTVAPSKEQILLAKTKALDKFFSDNIEEFADSWDLNFTASILDWQQKKNLRLTEKQERKLEEIYRDHSLDNSDDFEEGEKYHYGEFL